MNNKLMLSSSEWNIDTHLALIEKINLLDRRIKDIEFAVYGMSSVFNGDGRLVSTGGATPSLTQNYSYDGHWTSGWDYVQGGDIATVSVNGSTAHYTWTKDSYGNSQLVNTTYTTP